MTDDLVPPPEGIAPLVVEILGWIRMARNVDPETAFAFIDSRLMEMNAMEVRNYIRILIMIVAQHGGTT